MGLDFWITLLSIIFVLSIGMLVFLSQPREHSRKVFLLICSISSVWFLDNYVSDNPISASTLYPSTRLSFPLAYATVLAMLMFVSSFPIRVALKKSYTAFFIFSLFLITFLSVWTDLIVKSVTQNAGVTNVSTGALYVLFITFMLVAFATIVKVFLYTWRKLKKGSPQREQVGILLIGSFLAFSFGVITSIVIPNIFNLWIFAKLGPLSGVILVSFFGVAIARSKLFSIKTIAFRVLGYAMTIFVTTALFFALMIIATYIVIPGEQVSMELRISTLVPTIILLFMFDKIRTFIDKLTRKIFFQGEYSVHGSLSLLTDYTVHNSSTKKIEAFTLDLLGSTINPEFSGFLIYDNKNNLGISSSRMLPLENVESIIKNVPWSSVQKVTTFSNITSSSKLHSAFITYSLGAVVKISTMDRKLGYLVLGQKRSGRDYSLKDSRFLNLASNDLSLALENALKYEEIQAFNETLQNKINEATKALRRTNKKLIALDDAKDEFISMASHQLRTPLTSVKGYISMLLEEDLGKLNEQQKQALKEAFDSSQRMVFLISDFLNVSRMRTGRFMIERQQTDLAAIVEDEVKQLKDMAALRGQEITYQAPKNFPIVMLDENKIRQVMMNMLDNAIFYTPRDGKITVVLQKTKDDISYKVIDQGIGVPEKDQHLLFTKFFRAANAQRARPDGTGLGLFMAQKIITEQKGEIIFQSKEGEGSTFGFRFPLSEVKQNIDK